MSTTIGQWSTTGQGIVDSLEVDGGIALKASLLALVPQMATVIAVPVVGGIFSDFIGFICNKISTILVQNIDRLVYAEYVAVAVGKQVSDYVQASQSGNESATDQAADNLIHVGTT